MLLGNWGFPVAVSLFLLVRIERKQEGLSESIFSLSQAIREREKA